MQIGHSQNKQHAHSFETQKVVRLLDFLLRMASLRTKLTRDIAEYENVLWLSSIPHERGCFTQAWGRDEEHETDEWLEVQNRREPELPLRPAQIKDWVNESAIRNKNSLPELLPKIPRQLPNPGWSEGSNQSKKIPHNERLEDHPEVQRAWDRYVEEKWLPWTEEHNVWEKVHKVYSSLFSIHQSQLRLGEEYELVLGLGLLTWQTPTGQRVRRHLVVADAILEFDARQGIFTVRPHTEGAKLRPELDMLDIQQRPARAEESAKASMTAADDDPWEKGCVEGVLEALVHSINSEGDYDNSLVAKIGRATAKPIVEYAPAIILRKRSARGLTETLNRIKEQVETGGEIPGEFADLAEIRSKDTREQSAAQEEANSEFDGEIFFPKPSNVEQRRIIDKMRGSSGVLVQGPPGTGKSHTIANLISHLLATGQRILVTAKTPRALQVLMGNPEAEKYDGLVHEEIHPLCISLLGDGMKERKSLESSVGGILRKEEQWNPPQAKNERTALNECLRELREEKAKVSRRLHDIRESETHTQSIAEGTYRGTAARIAETVNRERADYEWFTDFVPLDKTCPISTSDLRNVLAALRQYTQEERRNLGLAWPQAMPPPERFASLVLSEATANDEEENSLSGADERFADLLAKNNSLVIEALRNAFATFRDTRRRLLATPFSWMKVASRDIIGGNSTLWYELLRITRSAIASIAGLVEIADEIRIELPETMDIWKLCEDARKLKEHLERGGKLGWGVFRPKLVKERLYVIKSVRLGGQFCSTAEHFSNLEDALHVRIEFEKAWSYWKGQSEMVQGPYTFQLAALMSLRDALENALALEELIGKCRQAISQGPCMSEPVWADESQIESILASCSLALARIRRRLAAAEIQSIESPISRMASAVGGHPVTHDLLSSIRSRDMDKYALCANQIKDFEIQRQRLQKADENLSKLHGLLPQLAASLEQSCNELYWEERTQRIREAWHWAQARYWIEDYIRQEDVPALAKRAKQIEDEINSIIAKLASLHAWSFCINRMEEQHRRHMESWCKHVDSLTKSGKGKRDFRNRRAAQRSLNECKDAVPAWVMPLHRVWDTVDPSPGMFDVIIVDEASQCGLEALPLLYLGKKILIVGDDKQISPSGEFQDTDPINMLLDEYLFDFKFKEYFDVNVSLFDHGKLRYGNRRIALREHFRCMPEIIRFSNDLCYSDTPLIPLRQYGPNRIPPLEHVFVSDGYRQGSGSRTINRPESEAIVTRIKEMCSDSRYDGKTMGVVVLQGEAQATLIENQLLERLGAEEMEQRRLVCGDPYNFQGDERDIMFLSLVAASNERIGPLTTAPHERRFNVAASRARDMMILFHSVTSDELSASCYRRRLLDFFQNTKLPEIDGLPQDELERRAYQDNRRVVKPPAPFDSWFELDVALELLRKNFTVRAQQEVAGKWIDLVVEGGQARLAVECDGDHWHGADRYEADMQRQRQLERCGWEFFRVRECDFYSNKENALAGLWQALEDRGIFAGSRYVNPTVEDDFEEQGSHELVGDFSANDDSTCDDDDHPSSDLTSEPSSSGRRAEEVAAQEIQDGILSALAKCPNHSCTITLLISRVLKEVGVLTRGKPRDEFERRTMHCISLLEEAGRIERYKAKNQRRVSVFLCK